MNSEQPDKFSLPSDKKVHLKLHLKRNKKVKVCLTISSIKLEFSNSITINSKKILSIPWSYVITCQKEENVNREDNESFILTFYYSPYISRRYFGIGKLKFSLNCDSGHPNEFLHVSDLCGVINQYISHSQCESEKPYLLILNPRSGTRTGQRIYNECISELFKQNNIKYELSITENALYARNLIKSSNSLDKYRAIVTVSGDGLIYEVLCGIMERESWKEDIGSIPIGIIPAGSGNGLAATVASFSGINPMGKIILHSTLLLRKPVVHPLDLMKLQTSTGNQFPSFLSLTWGLMAHVDVGSDKFRWMGTARFHVVAAIQIAKMSKYKGKLWYLPTNVDNDRECVSETIAESHLSCGNVEKMENNSFANTPFRYLPDISQPLPDSNNKWVLLDQSFITVIVSLLPYLATDAKIAPAAQMNDGKIHIIVINPDISRTALLNAILKLETGGHFISDSIRYIECVAFRLVPECDKCYMAVDGEYHENTAVQGEIMASVAKTLTGPCANGDIILR